MSYVTSMSTFDAALPLFGAARGRDLLIKELKGVCAAQGEIVVARLSEGQESDHTTDEGSGGLVGDGGTGEGLDGCGGGGGVGLDGS